MNNLPGNRTNRIKNVVVVVWKTIESVSNTNRSRTKGLSLNYPRLLHSLDPDYSLDAGSIGVEPASGWVKEDHHTTYLMSSPLQAEVHAVWT